VKRTRQMRSTLIGRRAVAAEIGAVFSACAKLTYPSKSAANRAVKDMRRKHGYGTTWRLRAYICPRCNEWHVGNDKFAREAD
jgi:hypothetical protein